MVAGPPRVVPVSPADLEALEDLFEACASSCFCRYWHFAGNKNEWLARCAHAPDDNCSELREAIQKGDGTGRGLVAYEEDDAVGWLKLGRRAALRKLTNLPVYRAYTAAGAESADVIACLLVRPSCRRKGVARALVAAAENVSRSAGAVALEAYPRHCEAPMHDEEAWMGPERVFIERGYEIVFGAAPYPVYRKRFRESNKAVT